MNKLIANPQIIYTADKGSLITVVFTNDSGIFAMEIKLYT